jgi:hypothetical protein
MADMNRHEQKGPAHGRHLGDVTVEGAHADPVTALPGLDVDPVPGGSGTPGQYDTPGVLCT